MPSVPPTQTSPYNGGCASAPGDLNDVALDQPAQCRRYGRTAMTLHRWQGDPRIAYPKPSFYIAGVPYTWFSVLTEWERRNPTRSALAGKTPNPRTAEQSVAA